MKKNVTGRSQYKYRSPKLLEFTKQIYQDVDLSKAYLIAQQHIVLSTYDMIEILLDLGLKKENISLIGKCYSTDVIAFQKFKQNGIDVCGSSVEFDSYAPYDLFYKKKIRDFLTKNHKKWAGSKVDKLIVLDDGGELILGLNRLFRVFRKKMHVVGIEQTSSGYTKISNVALQFPVINLARSGAKLKYETPIIAELSLSRLKARAPRKYKNARKILVIGSGIIGNYVYKMLRREYEVQKYDLNPSKSSISREQFNLSLGGYDIIIGCSGSQSFLPKFLKRLKKGAVLVSLSSSDREFSAVNLRRLLPRTKNCRCDVEVSGIKLLNSGFPITFDEKYEKHEINFLERLFLTRALIISSICQAWKTITVLPKIVPLDKVKQDQIVQEYKSIYFKSLKNNNIDNKSSLK